ncbi:hypothetical protein YC2023_030560 [Brassica napus]
MSVEKQASESKNNGSYYRCLSFSFVESSSTDGKKNKPLSLNRMDSKMLKADIVKWVKRVAAYAPLMVTRELNKAQASRHIPCEECEGHIHRLNTHPFVATL